MTIVDSSVWIDALRGVRNAHTIWLFDALGPEPIGLTSLILTEVLRGVHSPSQFEGFQRELMSLPVFETVSPELAVEAARNFLALRSRGITVRSTIDTLIATFCIRSGYRLLHRDRDFDHFEAHLGLMVLHPPASAA